MDLDDPVALLPLSEQLYQRLLNAILDGTFTDQLPSERELAARFGVNRNALREAIKRLQQARLVEVSQGGPTRVLDPRRHGRLDLLPQLVGRPDGLDLAVVAGVLEMRACVGADAARMCALRSPETGDGLARHVADWQYADAALADRLTRRFWADIVDGSGNLAYRLAFNSLVEGLDTTLRLSGGSPLGDALLRELRALATIEPIADAIAAGDARAAHAAALTHLRPVAETAGRLAAA